MKKNDDSKQGVSKEDIEIATDTAQAQGRPFEQHIDATISNDGKNNFVRIPKKFTEFLDIDPKRDIMRFAYTIFPASEEQELAYNISLLKNSKEGRKHYERKKR